MLHVFQVQKSEVHIHIFYDLGNGRRKKNHINLVILSRLKSTLETDSRLPEGVLWEKYSIAGEVRHERLNSL